MQYTRLDRYKIKQQMLRCKLEYFRELIDLAGISQTVFYTSLDNHKWRSQTLDALANALRCSPFDLLTIDNAGAYSDTPLQPSIREETS
jgi:DNA-binding Xre family transcriptional regulator